MLRDKSKINKALVLLTIVLVGLNLRPSMASIGVILSSMKADISLTFTMVSLLTMLPVFAMGIAMFVGISLARRVGDHRLISYSLVLIFFATFYRYYADDVMSLLVTAIIAGIGIALIQSVVPKIIKSRFPQSTELYMGVYVTAIMGGAALSASTSPFVGDYFSNWRIALSIWASLAVLGLVSWHAVKIHIGTNKREETNANISPPTFYKNTRAWTLGVFFGLGTSAYTCVLAWLPPYYFDLGWGDKESGLILAFLTSVEVIAGLSIPTIASRNKDRRGILFFLLICIIIGFVGLITKPESLALLWASLLGLGIGGLFPMSLIVAMDHVDEPAHAGQLTAFVQGIGYMIAALSPLIAGYIKDTSASFTAAWGMLVIAAGLMLLIAYKFKPADYEIHFAKVSV